MMDLIGKDASGVYAVWLSTGSDFQKITWSPSGGPANSSILKPGAFLGDGKTDVLEIRNGMLIVWPASGAQNTAFAAPQMWLSSSGIAGNKDQIVIGDYNSDGRADITDYNGNVFLSTGIGFSSVGRWASWGGYSDTCRAYVGDMSGHGNRDLILINSCVCNCNGAFVQVSAAQVMIIE